jgi:hypothetical protein
MVEVIILENLKSEILKKFGREAGKIFRFIKSLEENPRKGKLLGNVGGIVIKELRYKSFRFYFITNGFKLKVLNGREVVDILMRFVRMSDKKSQQKVINEIREILQKVGVSGFD